MNEQIDVTTLQRYLPAFVKNTLKPYYRKLFQNQLCVVLMITFRCNYRCSYCPWVTRFAYSNIYIQKNEPTPEKWIYALDKLPNANVYIGGGEPFLYDGLPELVNALSKHKMLGIVTNAAIKTAVYARITRKIHLNLSFHRELVTEEDFLNKINELQKVGVFHLNVNLVATRENVPMIPRIDRVLADHNVSLHIDIFIDPDAKFEYTPEEREILSRYLAPDRSIHLDALNFNSYAPKECSAGQNYICIMPDGTVFRCLSGSDYFHSPSKKRLLDMGPDAPYDSSFFLMGNIFDSGFKLDKKPVYCRLPCTAGCDWDMAKIKMVK